MINKLLTAQTTFDQATAGQLNKVGQWTIPEVNSGGSVYLC